MLVIAQVPITYRTPKVLCGKIFSTIIPRVLTLWVKPKGRKKEKIVRCHKTLSESNLSLPLGSAKQLQSYWIEHRRLFSTFIKDGKITSKKCPQLSQNWWSFTHKIFKSCSTPCWRQVGTTQTFLWCCVPPSFSFSHNFQQTSLLPRAVLILYKTLLYPISYYSQGASFFPQARLSFQKGFSIKMFLYKKLDRRSLSPRFVMAN